MANRKQKTKKAAAKRYKVTAKKKIKFSRAGVRHIATGYSRKRNRQLKGTGVCHPSDRKMAINLLPYGSTL